MYGQPFLESLQKEGVRIFPVYLLPVFNVTGACEASVYCNSRYEGTPRRCVGVYILKGNIRMAVKKGLYIRVL